MKKVAPAWSWLWPPSTSTSHNTLKLLEHGGQNTPSRSCQCQGCHQAQNLRCGSHWVGPAQKTCFKIIALKCQIILTCGARDVLEKEIERSTKIMSNYSPSSPHPQCVLILRVLCSTSGWFCSTLCHNKHLQDVIQPHENSHLSSSSLQLLASSPCPIIHVSIHNHS